jgi:hypothetical protein
LFLTLRAECMCVCVCVGGGGAIESRPEHVNAAYFTRASRPMKKDTGKGRTNMWRRNKLDWLYRDADKNRKTYNDKKDSQVPFSKLSQLWPSQRPLRFSSSHIIVN